MRTLLTSLVLVGFIAEWSVADPVMVIPENASSQIQLAGQEVRRYVYLRTGLILPTGSRQPQKGESIVLSVDPELGAQTYRLKTTGDSLHISGGDDLGVLYGAYAFAEKLGVRFYLHGDVIPDRKISW